MESYIESLNEKVVESKLGGGEARLEKELIKGKLGARRRLQLLFDPDTFQEFDAFVTHNCYDFGMEKKKFLGDGVVTGTGLVNGRRIFAYAQDFTVFGGSLSLAYANKICKVMDMALKSKVPLVGLNDSGGARIQEGVNSLGGYAEIFWRNVECSGVIPQLSLIMGPCAGGAVYSPAITDFISMVDDSSYMFLTGPDVIKEVTNEVVTQQELGGSHTHNEISGVAHFRNESEESAIAHMKILLSYIPSNCDEKPPVTTEGDVNYRETTALRKIVPINPTKPYDMLDLVNEVVDQGSLLVSQEDFAPNIVTAFARVGGRVIGVVANNPMHMAGVLDIDASNKSARFIRFCDCFNIPLVSFVDVPGFLPGVEQEHGGIIKNGAKLLYAYSEATVPMITVITRKAYGGAYDVMSSKHIRADLNFAFPNAEIAVMGAKGAVNILYRNEIKDNPDLKDSYIEQYEKRFANPYEAASKGYIDEVIDPALTRNRIIDGLDLLKDKLVQRAKRKHGNIPL
ncbi:acyl-CoA carboxylase subunit beta [bacterium]|nr:acyl-CoA carboxylase subunit beta [bacterium]